MYIQPQATAEIKIELLGTKPGAFVKEIWIKTEPLHRLRILGNFIEPKLEIQHPLQTYSLTLMQFPRTYYGAQCSKILVINNSSSRCSMFCTVAEFGGQTMVRKQDFNDQQKKLCI